MSDVDGTLVPYDYQALPSDIVADAVIRAQEKVSVNLVTGRAYNSVIGIIDKLELHTGFAVLNNGAQVVNLATKELIYDRPILHDDARYIIDYFQKKKIPFFLKQEQVETIEHRIKYSGESLIRPYMFFTEEIFTRDEVESVLLDLSELSNVTLHKGHHKIPHKYSINISHVNATKLHGIGVLKKELRIKTDEIIGIGDSYNDFPLLMASGLKVAMGNAVDELKAIADFIAPDVHDNGVATVINTFILHHDN